MKNKFFLTLGFFSTITISTMSYAHVVAGDKPHSHDQRTEKVTDVAKMSYNPHAGVPSSTDIKRSNTPCMKNGSELFTEINQIIQVSNGDMDKAKELLLKSKKWAALSKKNRDRIAEIMFKSVANPEKVESYRQIFAESLMKQCNK